MSKLTKLDVMKIRCLLCLSGSTWQTPRGRRTLAMTYGVCKRTIDNIYKNRSWVTNFTGE